MKTPPVLALVAAFAFGSHPLSAADPQVAAEILTPKIAATPRINGPKVFGVRPGSPFLYAIPATGDRPMAFAATGLPAGLKLNPATGRITGVVRTPGEFKVTLRAQNALGVAEKPFRIVVGKDIQLTPAMGWNSYNCFGVTVTQDKALRAGLSRRRIFSAKRMAVWD